MMSKIRKMDPAAVVATVLVIAEIIGVAFLLLQSTFLIQPTAGTGSMVPTIQPYETTLLDRGSYWFHGPARGDVIVFAAPPQPWRLYEKRVIAIPGDTIDIDVTRVTLNGVVLNEQSYVRYQGNPNGQEHLHIHLPAACACYFVMGDNRAGSYDSRFWWWVPRANIIGRTVMVLGPRSANNLGFLPSVAATFTGVPPSLETMQQDNTVKAALLLSSLLLLLPVLLYVVTQKLYKRP